MLICEQDKGYFDGTVYNDHRNASKSWIKESLEAKSTNQTGSISDIPVAMRTDKIQTAVDSVVNNMPAIQPRLITKVSFILLVNVINYWLPTVEKKESE